MLSDNLFILSPTTKDSNLHLTHKIIEPQNENKSNKVSQEIALRISENPRVHVVIETIRKIVLFFKSTSIIRFLFIDIVNEQNHSILINDDFIDLEKNQPTFLQPANVNTYNAVDDGIFEDSSELDEIFHWGFRQWCTVALFYGSYVIFIMQFLLPSYSLNPFKI
ncbi:14677_t:CDS:2 [Ambispora leptoticha]|uniref:14677_t:CDS:1 n=1 Tax=Ambispora leptoticha TaxID=144679 RepID=A0A9N9CV96_9GLOM|nr:14677_t:CDS:2 [Ambispora leptoticha]